MLFGLLNDLGDRRARDASSSTANDEGRRGHHGSRIRIPDAPIDQRGGGTQLLFLERVANGAALRRRPRKQGAAPGNHRSGLAPDRSFDRIVRPHETVIAIISRANARAAAPRIDQGEIGRPQAPVLAHDPAHATRAHPLYLISHPHLQSTTCDLPLTGFPAGQQSRVVIHDAHTLISARPSRL
jgi:hypothetical protein